MSDKLTVWTAAKEVSTAVGTMVNTYKTLRTVKKQESIIAVTLEKRFVRHWK